MWSGNSAFQLLIITAGGKFTGLFVYAGNAPANGNLVASITAQAGTDPFGNSYDAGIAQYVTIGGTKWSVDLNKAVAAFGGTLAGLTIDNESVPWAVPASVTGLETGGGANLELSSGLQTGGGQQSALILRDSVAGGTANGLIVMNAGTIALQNPSFGVALHMLLDAANIPYIRADNYLTLLNQGSAPAAHAGEPLIYADSAGFLNTKADSASGDTTAYAIGHFTAFSTSDEPVGNLAFGIVCHQGAVVAAAKYRVRAVLQCQQGPVSDFNDYRLGFTGTISQVRMSARFVGAGGVANSVFADVTTSNNGLLQTPAFAPGAIYVAEFDGIIVTTSTGTVSIQAACDTNAAHTFTVLALSLFHLERIG